MRGTSPHFAQSELPYKGERQLPIPFRDLPAGGIKQGGIFFPGKIKLPPLCPKLVYHFSEDEETTSIIEFREEDIETYPELDSYYVDKLKQIGKSEDSVLGSSSSVLWRYFGENVFHDMIYGEIKDAFEELLGKL